MYGRAVDQLVVQVVTPKSEGVKHKNQDLIVKLKFQNITYLMEDCLMITVENFSKDI